MTAPSSSGGYVQDRLTTDGAAHLVTPSEGTPNEGNAQGWVSSHSSPGRGQVLASGDGSEGHSLFPARDEGTGARAAAGTCSRSRAISVRQPWAWAIAEGGKDVENRTRRDPWHTAIGERVFIHAAKTVEVYDYGNVRHLSGVHPPDDLATGALIATAVIQDVHHAYRCFDRLLTYCSKWAQPDSWHLVLADVIPLPEPIAWRGALGLFEVSW